MSGRVPIPAVAFSSTCIVGVRADDRLAVNQRHAIHSAAFKVCSNLVLYYSSGGYGGAIRNLEAYRAGMAWLREQGERSGDSALQAPLRQMNEQIAMLERNGDIDRLLKPRWVIQTLQAQAQLGNHLAERYAGLDGSPGLLLLHEQSLDVNRILLMYQIRAFGSLAIYFMEVGEGTPQHLDARVIERFRQLATRLPERAQEFGELERRYRYIRPRPLDGNGNQLAAGAEYYLGESSRRSTEWQRITRTSRKWRRKAER